MSSHWVVMSVAIFQVTRDIAIAHIAHECPDFPCFPRLFTVCCHPAVRQGEVAFPFDYLLLRSMVHIEQFLKLY